MKNIDNLKLCIWMNFSSHHQSDFFDCLYNDNMIDLIVRYSTQVPDNRIENGWIENPVFKPYEKLINKKISLALIESPDWKERIHIISPFLDSQFKELIKIFINEKVNWIHWSERSGIALNEMMRFNKYLTKIFYTLSLHYSGRKKYAKSVNQYALGAFAIGKTAKIDFICWGIDREKIEYMYYALSGLGQNYQSHRTNFKQKTISYCYIGELSKRKGTEILIKAFAELKNRMGAKLHLIGPDLSNGFYKSLIKKKKIEKEILLTGSIQIKNIEKYFSKCDVFILPSRYDGWGVVLNEAASLGKALIATDQCGAAYHLIEDKKNGFRIKSHNINSLKKAMQFYIDHPEYVKLHGDQSLEVFKYYTPEQNVQRLINAINKWQNT